MLRAVPNADSSSASPLRRSSQLLGLKKYILAGVAAVVMLAWCFVVAYVVSDRWHTTDAARNRLLSLGIALNAHTEAIFADGLGTARAAANHLAASGGIQTIDPNKALNALRSELTGGEYLAALFVSTPARTLIVNRAGYQRSDDVIPEWLGKVFANMPEVFVGAPMPNPANPSRMVLPIARRLIDQNGGPLYAGAWFDVGALEQHYAAVLPRGGVMGLLSENGSILARLDLDASVRELPLPDAQDLAIYRRSIDIAQQEPTIVVDTPPDGVAMMYAISIPEPRAPLLAVTGQSMRSILERWWSRMAAVLALMVTFTAVLLWLAAMLGRYLTKLDQAQVALEQANQTLELRVKERTAELRERNEELEAFTAAVSHDLRSPLIAIAGHAGLLAITFAGDSREEVSKRIDGVKAGVRRAVEVIEGLLSLARVSRQELHVEKVSLSELVSECINDIRAQEPDRQVDCRIQEGIVVVADSRLMKSLMSNLVSNAWKYSAGKQRVEIEFTCEQTAEGPRYCLRDKGAGFDMAQVSQLFQPFRRLHTLREFPGTGVGLATVARIVRRYGGSVTAQGELGSGATFCFTLPLAQVTDCAELHCA